ncbi:MAG: hypothetical protein K1X79_02120 [Oligoflexia bacterium]|nr:hypothetical protein [Oligoflexia bacterium]
MIQSACYRAGLIFGLFVQLVACTPAQDSARETPSIGQLANRQLSPQESQELLDRVGQNWLYGNGIGETALTAGSIFVFPPYALYVLGNAALSLGGYEQVRLSNALPEEERKNWLSVYDEVTSGPGRLNAAVSGREFITRERARARIGEVLQTPPAGTSVEKQKK